MANKCIHNIKLGNVTNCATINCEIDLPVWQNKCIHCKAMGIYRTSKCGKHGGNSLMQKQMHSLQSLERIELVNVAICAPYTWY